VPASAGYGRIPAFIALAVLLYFLLFFGLDGVGLLSVDEPRYAAIGREMAYSGDFITPHLWGSPWFEKPPLLYWTIGLATWDGLDDEIAARLPVAMLSAAFLLFLYRVQRREFGAGAAACATMLLACSAGWVVYSQFAVTDLPMAACFSAAMLLSLPWAGGGQKTGLRRAGLLLGLAVLAKGLVPLVLALPVVAFGWRRWRDLAAAAGMILLVATPWYWLCYRANGKQFLEEFFWRHHVERFATDSLLHVQPFWFYVPILAAGLFPWTPVLPLLSRRELFRDRRILFLAVTAAWGFMFFSLSQNKLPGYLLPLLPLVAVLLGAALPASKKAVLALIAAAACLAAIPVLAGVLPAALANGLSRAVMPPLSLSWLAWALVPALAVWIAGRRFGTIGAVCALFAATVIGVSYLKMRVYPVLDEQVSARGLWRGIESRAGQVCLGEMHRSWLYGLNYYAIQPLPDCDRAERPLQLQSINGKRPELTDKKPFSP